MLITNKTVTIDKITFCGLCPPASLHVSHLHGHPRITKSQDIININVENANSQGSSHSGMKYDEWANSGANKLITAKATGNTQQNRCGNIVAIIPSFIALFFIVSLEFLGVPSRNRTCIRGLGNPRSIQLNYGDEPHIF